MGLARPNPNPNPSRHPNPNPSRHPNPNPNTSPNPARNPNPNPNPNPIPNPTPHPHPHPNHAPLPLPLPLTLTLIHAPVRANGEHARRGRPLDLDLRQTGVERPGVPRYVRLGRGLGLGWGEGWAWVGARGKPPCASGACSTEGTGTRSLFVQYKGSGAYVSV